MSDLTERLIALRDYLRNTPGGRPALADLDTLAEAANRIAELELAQRRHQEQFADAEAERDHYREALEVAYWAYANLEAERDRYREALAKGEKGGQMKKAGRPSQVIGRSGTSGSLIRLSEQEGEG